MRPQGIDILFTFDKKDRLFTWGGKAVKDMRSAFASACQRAGIQDFRFHDLRHTFASRLVQGGVPLYEVMNLTGHKSLSMVQRYAHLAPEFQEAAIRVLDRRPDTFGHNSGTVENHRPSEMAVSH